jgi:3-hydroxyacyl-CoA dehydrogenase/enoyl-CoA hydratase/3-hydroxybutyryl-CoA epimerase
MSNEIYTVDVDNDGIALVTWDMTDRSMNVFTQERSMDSLTRWSTGSWPTTPSRAWCSHPAKPTFSGGADLTMMKTMLAGMAEEKCATTRITPSRCCLIRWAR